MLIQYIRINISVQQCNCNQMKWHGCHWIDNHETRLQKSWIKFALYKAKSISKTNFNHLCVTKNCKGYVESHGNKNQWGKYQKKRQMTAPLFSIWQTAIAVYMKLCQNWQSLKIVCFIVWLPIKYIKVTRWRYQIRVAFR